MSGLSPPNSLSYTGQVAVPSINRTFPPTTSFNDFNVPTIWTDTLGMNAYILVAKPQGVAEWVLIGGEPGVLATLTGNSGGAISPDAGNINIVGDTTTINIVGTPLDSTLTVSATGSVAILFTEDSGTATPSSGNVIVTGGSTGITTSGSGHTISLTGTLNVAHGGTGDTSFTAYSVITGGTTSTAPLQNVSGVGTLNQILTSNGAGALPSWGPPPAWVLVSSNSPSSSTGVVITDLTFVTYFLVVHAGVNTNNDQLILQVSTDNGATFFSTLYTSGVNYNAYNSTTLHNTSTTASMVLSAPCSNSSAFNGFFYLTGINEASSPHLTGNIVQFANDLGSQSFGTMGGIWSGANVNAIKILASSGTFNGFVGLYGLRI